MMCLRITSYAVEFDTFKHCLISFILLPVARLYEEIFRVLAIFSLNLKNKVVIKSITMQPYSQMKRVFFFLSGSIRFIFVGSHL